MENILIETDSPYLAPEPYRGSVNVPSNIPIIANKIAELKGVKVEEVEATTTKNCKLLFNIK